MGGVLFWVLIGLGGVVAVLLLITLVGCCLPSGHRASRALTLKQPPEAVWQVISDFAAEPQWHQGIEKVERLADKNDHAVWRETFAGGYPMQLETLEATAPSRLLRQIADEKGPFTGRWEFDLTPLEQGSKLTITEVGEVRNPFFRFMARLF